MTMTDEELIAALRGRHGFDVCQEAADRLSALTAAKPVTVSPLEWEESENDLQSDSLVGLYHITVDDADLCVLRLNYHSVGQVYQTVLAKGVGPNGAKAAAHADYEQRILSTLSQEHVAGESEAEAVKGVTHRAQILQEVANKVERETHAARERFNAQGDDYDNGYGNAGLDLSESIREMISLEAIQPPTPELQESAQLEVARNAAYEDAANTVEAYGSPAVTQPLAAAIRAKASQKGESNG